MAKGGKGKPQPVSSTPQVTGLTGVVVNTNSAYLKWTPVVNATTYWVYRNNYVLAIIPPSEYTDPGPLSPGTYTYEIRAVVATVLGPKSLPLVITI